MPKEKKNSKPKPKLNPKDRKIVDSGQNYSVGRVAKRIKERKEKQKWVLDNLGGDN
jgi:hypothetical protein